jgi:proteasome lid subunit RPN8/RPN11
MGRGIMIDIKKNHIDQIKEHAQKDYPYECCGILLGKFSGSEKTVTEILEISNEKEEENRHNRYLIPSSKIYIPTPCILSFSNHPL